MNETPEHNDDAAKAGGRERMMRTVRVVWIILIAAFTLLIALRLYSWRRGEDGLSGILSPLGMISLGLAQIVGKRNKPLYYAFLWSAMILVFTGLALLFLY